MIANMGVEIEGVEYLTTAEAVELAESIGKSITRPSVTRAARRGQEGIESGIEDCIKIGDTTSAWLIPQPQFIKWLQERKPRGKSK